VNASCSLDEVVRTSRVAARYRPVIGTNKAKVCVLVFPSDVASCIAFLLVMINMKRSAQPATGTPVEIGDEPNTKRVATSDDACTSPVIQGIQS